MENQTGEVRKLQVTGGSTYIVSLPKRWIIQNQLKKGSSIKLHEEEGGVLSIFPSDSLKVQKTDVAFITVSAGDNPDAVIRKVVSSYLVGYNMILIKSPKDQQLVSKYRNSLKDFARRMLVGTEIVTDTPTELTLQVLLSYPQLSIQSALRRMCIITSSMHKDAIMALKNLDSQLAKSVIATDSEVDRFNLYVIRQLKTAVQNPRVIKEMGLTNTRDCLGYRLVTKSVERTADHAVSIADNVLLLERPLNDEMIERIEKMSTISISMFETSVEALFKQDFNLAESLIEKMKNVESLEEEAVNSSEEIRADESASLRLIIESVRRTAEYAVDIAEIVLNLTVDSMIK
jgi:phosphate uptake regulator